MPYFKYTGGASFTHTSANKMKQYIFKRGVPYYVDNAQDVDYLRKKISAGSIQMVEVDKEGQPIQGPTSMLNKYRERFPNAASISPLETDPARIKKRVENPVMAEKEKTVELPDVSEMKISDAQELIRETDDVDILELFKEAEESGKGRKTLLGIIDTRIRALSGDEEGDDDEEDDELESEL